MRIVDLGIADSIASVIAGIAVLVGGATRICIFIIERKNKDADTSTTHFNQTSPNARKSLNQRLQEYRTDDRGSGSLVGGLEVLIAISAAYLIFTAVRSYL